MAFAPTIPEEALKALMASQPRGKGTSIYSIISAQAGGVSDAILRVLAGTKLDDFKTAIDDLLNWYDTLATESAKKKTYKQLAEVKEAVWNNIVADTKRLIDTWKAGLGLQMGTAYMSLEETYMGVPQLVSMYKTEQLDASVRPRLERYWRATYTPNIPNSVLAFRMLMEGKLSRTEFNDFCLQEGWSTDYHDKLYAVYDRDPDEYLAFSMFKRGLISEAKMKELFRIRGYDASYDSILYQALHRRPSFRELTNLADYVVLPDLWVREVFRAQGYLETDINYMALAIQKRPLREEVRSIAGRLVWQFQIGRLDITEVKKSLEALGLLPNEVSLWLEWAHLRYYDELLDEKLAIIEARVDAGDPDFTTQEEIKDAIVDLGVLEEKANLMAELWYYKYLYVP